MSSYKPVQIVISIENLVLVLGAYWKTVVTF